MTILITGAAGRTSGFVLNALLQSGHSDLRLFVRSDSAIQKLQSRYPQLPRSAFAVGDYLEASTLSPALQGIDVVFHNAPAFHPNEMAMGVALVEAAKQAGVQHFVYCSVLFPILTKMLHHKVKRDVEEYLIESGLNYTILEPTSFMQNVDVEAVRKSSTLRATYSLNTLQGYLDLQDLAAVARTVLLDPAPHNRARYELVGQNCTFEDLARILSAHLGHEVTVKRINREDVVTGMHVVTQGDYAVETLDRMLYYYDRRGIPGNNNVLRWLLGRAPTTWEGRLKRDLSQ